MKFEILVRFRSLPVIRSRSKGKLKKFKPSPIRYKKCLKLLKGNLPESVTLDDLDGAHLIAFSVEFFPGKISAKNRLQLNHHVANFEISIFLELRQDSGSEKDLRLSDAVEPLVEVQPFEHHFGCLFGVHNLVAKDAGG